MDTHADQVETAISDINLGRLAVSAKNWEWCRGLEAMATLHGNDWKGHGRVIVDRFDKDTGSVFILSKRDFLGKTGTWLVADDPVPIVDSPTAKGWLLHLVRQAWAIPNAWVVNRNGIWHVCWSGAMHGGDLGIGPTEHEALVRALLNADAEPQGRIES